MSEFQLLKIFCLVFFLAMANSASAEGQFLRSKGDLGDPRGYCIDIPGWGASMKLDDPIVAHSCKYGNPMFSVDGIVSLSKNKLLMTNYDRCLSAKKVEASAKIYATDCEAAHEWTISQDGKVTPSMDGSLCLSFSKDLSGPVYSVPTIVPAFKARKLSLESCKQSDYQWQRWRWSDSMEQPEKSANSMLAAMPPSISKSIRDMGSGINVSELTKLYKAQQRMFLAEDLSITKEISYGPDANHKLDVYQNKAHRTPGGSPVIIIMGGQNFEDSSSIDLSNVAIHFAGLGFASVYAQYPEGSAQSWPTGAQAVASVVKWVEENIKDYDGSPEWINLLGYAAGGNHVANYVLRPSLSKTDNYPIVTAIIASPILITDPSITEMQEYFMNSGFDMSQLSLSNNIESASVPLLITTAEMDSKASHLNAANLYRSLIKESVPNPRLRQMPGHNAISYMMSIGTHDGIFTEEALDFIMRTKQFHIGDH